MLAAGGMLAFAILALAAPAESQIPESAPRDSGPRDATQTFDGDRCRASWACHCRAPIDIR
jgi:hypothetical protein